MDRRINAFHQDAAGDWVAVLECGHGQHVRHNPPWQVREWVLSEESRRARVGSTLDCILCEADAASNLSPAEAAAYRDARLQGLCHDGAMELLRSSSAIQKPQR